MTTQEAELKWPAITNFVRHLTHDFRNHLYSISLEAAFLADSVDDPECADSVKRIQNQLRESADVLKELVDKFADPNPTLEPITARDLFSLIREQADHVKNLPATDWSGCVDGAMICVDAANVAQAARELLNNAVAFGNGEGLKVIARADGSGVTYDFIEMKKEPIQTNGWGYDPFVSNRRGGYGLGLWQTRRIVEASGGIISHRYDPETMELRSAMTFPRMQLSAVE